jgi:hypothetical protein
MPPLLGSKWLSSDFLSDKLLGTKLPEFFRLCHLWPDGVMRKKNIGRLDGKIATKLISTEDFSIMQWLYDVAYFFGGAFLINALPHLISGLTGRAFQSPFAKPSGQGLSSSIVNVLWGFFNLVMAYLLLCRVGTFDIRALDQISVLALGALLLGLFNTHHFGQYHGGNDPHGHSVTQEHVQRKADQEKAQEIVSQ